MVEPAVEERIRAHLACADHAGAATEAIRSYGPKILAYLRSVLRDEAAASEVFCIFSEHLWKGMATFESASSFSTWAYRVAWGAVRRFHEDGYRRRARSFATSEASRLAEEIRSSTAAHLRTDVKDRVAQLRASLTPEEQTLLTLRIDRDLSWSEVAEVLGDADEAALRKRFERIKNRLRKLASEAGLL